jgi:uncharacterized cupin superfamily protein
MTRNSNEQPMKPLQPWILLAALGLAVPLTAMPVSSQQEEGYQRASAGTRTLTLASGLRIKMLLEAAILGDDGVEVAEISFPVGTNPPSGHRHGATEILYVVDGVLGHVVDGVEYRLEAGMVGVVKPGDDVTHRVLSDVPVKAVVIWVPGGEADRIAAPDRWRPVGSSGTQTGRPRPTRHIG